MKTAKRVAAGLLAAALTLPCTTALAAVHQPIPNLDSVAVTEQRRDGNELQFRVQLKIDGDMKLVDHAALLFENLQTKDSASILLRARDLQEDGSYAGWLKINAYVINGTYVLKQAMLVTEEGDYHVYMRPEDLKADQVGASENPLFTVVKSRLERSVSFIVTTGYTTADEAAPVLQDFTLEQSSIETESKLKIRAQATDGTGSGIDSFRARFVDPATGRGLSVTFEQKEEGWMGVIPAAQTKDPKEYRLDSVTLKDKAGNRVVYEPGDAPLGESVGFAIVEE